MKEISLAPFKRFFAGIWNPVTVSTLSKRDLLHNSFYAIIINQECLCQRLKR